MKRLRDYCPLSAVVYCTISVLIGVVLAYVTRYAQEEIHRQFGDLYEVSFRFTTDEPLIPDFFFREKEHVTLLCYERQNPMEYVWISGEKDLAVLDNNYETVQQEIKNMSKDTIFWAVSDRKHALEIALWDWENALLEEGKILEICEERRITADGLLGSKRYVYLVYGISWVGLLLFHAGNFMVYVRGRKKTAEVYFLLGIPGYFSNLKRRQLCTQVLLCFFVLTVLKSYCWRSFVCAVFLFYLSTTLVGVLCINRHKV